MNASARITRDNPALWIAVLTIASLIATAVLECRMPFAALGVMAALHMRRGEGLAMVLMVWATSQVAGFTLLGYPHDPSTIGWGIALGLGAVSAVLAAELALGVLRGAPALARVAMALVAAFAAFKLAIVAFALKLGGVAMLVSPTLLARQFGRETAVLVGLLIAYHLLVRIGLPRAGRPRLGLA